MTSYKPKRESEYLKRNLLKLKNIDNKESFLLEKLNDIKDKHLDIHPLKDDMFNNFTLQDLQNIDIELIFVENKKVNKDDPYYDIWHYYRDLVSIMPFTGVVGRQVKILVKDKTTNKYLGILCLASDSKHNPARDDFIGWNKEQKRQTLDNLINIQCCVPLQPFGYNCLGGKLLTSLVFTDEVISYFEQKYNTTIAGVTTTSLYGKSIQYDRLPYLKFIGMTKGVSCVHVPQQLYNRGMKYMDHLGIKPNYKGSDSKKNKIKALARHLDIKEDILNHGNKRGVYFGYNSSDSQKFLLGEITEIYNDKLKTVKEITEWWKNRWAKNRLQNLITKNELKEIPNFKNDIESELKKIKKERIASASKIRSQKYREQNGEEYTKNHTEYMRQWRQSKKAL